ncbi:MAG: DUF1566 domain-containing protein [Taibaiella sp.]|nr:DUF1566 domain-containing protein [Taibaiella sp.]
MKKTILLTLLSFYASLLFAQSPHKMSFQAVVRNSGNNLVVDDTVGMRISILQGTASGTPVYVETHTPHTNANGLATLIIGNGTVVTGNIDSINWAAGPYFIKTETDPTGGTSYSITATQQLMSVPYALYAEKAGSAAGTGYTHYIGEHYGGGVVFAVWKDGTGAEHGLVVGLNDLGIDILWGCAGTSLSGARSTWNGAANTATIVDSCGTATAAGFCDTSTAEGFTDWYLPAINELDMIRQQRFFIEKAFSTITGAINLFMATSNLYCSSTEIDYYSENIWVQNYLSGEISNRGKDENYYVRAVRAF